MPNITVSKCHRFLEGGANNLPDAQSHRAAKEILAVANKAVREDIVMALISGGGSALLPCPVEGVTLEDKRRVSFFLHTHVQCTSFTHTYIHPCKHWRRKWGGYGG